MSVTGELEGSEGRTFTADQVQAILDGRERELNREWQGRLTQVQQAKADTQREIGSLRATIESLEKRIGQSPGRGEARSPNGLPPDWSEIQTAEQLYHAAVRDAAARAQSEGTDVKAAVREALEELGLPERLEAAEDSSLEGELDGIRRAYGGRLDDGHIRQVLQTAQDTGNGDLEYVAFRLFGPPPSSQPRPDDQDGRDRRTQAVLSGRARHQQAVQTPKTVKVRRGMQGYADVEKIANELYPD